jgi:hypothetical protein
MRRNDCDLFNVNLEHFERGTDKTTKNLMFLLLYNIPFWSCSVENYFVVSFTSYE